MTIAVQAPEKWDTQSHFEYCWVDSRNGEVIIAGVEGQTVIRLRGYAILPLERLVALSSADKRAAQALLDNMRMEDAQSESVGA